MWRNPSPLQQTWGFLTQPFSWHQIPLLWLSLSLGFLLTEEGGMSQCQMLPPLHSERSLNNIISLTWLVNPNFCSQPGRPQEAQWNHVKGPQMFLTHMREGGSSSSHTSLHIQVQQELCNERTILAETKPLHPHSTAVQTRWNIHPRDKQE